ncbi:zinc finger and BTB domain-containing protein 8A.2-like [Pelodytes ibericus]
MDTFPYHTQLLKELDEQRQKDLFCDCHILVQGKMFKAHRNVLFASSGYFKMLLSQSCRDVGQPTIATFDVFSADTFTAILDYIYSGKLPLSGQNVIEVMSAASYLQMTDVISVCKTFIKSSLDINEKERDGFFGLPEKESGRQHSEYSLYNVGWGVENCTSTHSDMDMSGCMDVTSPWSQYGFHPKRSDLSSTQNGNSTSHKTSDSAIETPQLPSSTCCTEERARGIRISDANRTTEMEEFKGEYQETEEPEAIPKCWTVTQEKENSQSLPINSAAKADQLYATMPTIMGIIGSWGEDVIPSTRFKCPFCTHMVKRKADLKRHLRCHTGERPYPCQACGKRFTRLEHVRSHFRTIHEAGKPICRRCKRPVTEESGHVVQDGTRRFRLCNECMAEVGVDCIPIDFDDDDPPTVLPGDADKKPPWNLNGIHFSEPEIIEDTSSDLIIHEVDDSDDEIKPIIC